MMRRTAWGIAAAAGVLVLATAVVLFAWPRRVPTPSGRNAGDWTHPAVIPDPYDSPQAFMEGIYAAQKRPSVPSACRPFGVVVPHHLTASETAAVGIRALAGQGIKNILLITPDHFNRCPTAFCTADVAYDTQLGRTDASKDIVRSLLASPLVTDDSSLFRDEHGVYAVAPFVAWYLPGVTVTPLAVSMDSPWKAERQELLDIVSRVVDDKTVVVVSSDFSHYLTLKDAEVEDGRTSSTIMSGDLDSIASLKDPDQSDCPACLWLMAALAKRRGASDPTILMHSNSATILHDEHAPQTTSHFAIEWCDTVANP